MAGETEITTEDGTTVTTEDGVSLVLFLISDGFLRVVRWVASRFKRRWSVGAPRRALVAPVYKRRWSVTSVGVSVMNAKPAETLEKTRLEVTDYGFNYTNTGAIRNGDTIVSAEVSVTPTGGLDKGTPEVTTEDWTDSDGKVVAAGKGVLVRLGGGSPGVVYTVGCRATTQGGQVLEETVKILVYDSPQD